MDQTSRSVRGKGRTIRQALAEAALQGFASQVNTYDSGQTIIVEQAVGHISEGRIPRLSISYEWGEDASAIKRIDQHVAEHRQRREDDASVMHEGTYTE